MLFVAPFAYASGLDDFLAFNAATKSATARFEQQVADRSGKVVETMTVWADANQRALRELAELSAATAKEGVRLYAELQQTGIEAVRDAQATAMGWQTSWQDAPRDPMAWYQRALTDSVENAQKWFRILEGNAQAVTRTADRSGADEAVPDTIWDEAADHYDEKQLAALLIMIGTLNLFNRINVTVKERADKPSWEAAA